MYPYPFIYLLAPPQMRLTPRLAIQNDLAPIDRDDAAEPGIQIGRAQERFWPGKQLQTGGNMVMSLVVCTEGEVPSYRVIVILYNARRAVRGKHSFAYSDYTIVSSGDIEIGCLINPLQSETLLRRRRIEHGSP